MSASERQHPIPSIPAATPADDQHLTAANALREDIVALRARVERLDSQRNEITASPAVPSTNEATVFATESPRHEPPPSPPSEADVIGREVERLEQWLASEDTDPDWAIWAEEELVERFEQLAIAGSTLVASWCAATLCHSEFLTTDQASRLALVRAIYRTAPWATDAFFYVDPDDELTVVTYMTREGHALTPADVAEGG